MDLELNGKTAVVTGASKGLGHAIALKLAAEGCDLHIAARNHQAFEDLKATAEGEFGVRVTVHGLDLATAEGRTTLAERCASSTDILVNNAGAIPNGEIDALTEAQWRDGWELKVMGYISLTRSFYMAMKERKAGVILNIIGAAGVRYDAGYIAGTAGNAALNALTCALGARSVDFGIRVLGINPSLTATERAEGILDYKASRSDAQNFREDFLARLPLGRMAVPEEVADLAAFLVSNRASYVSGTVVNLDGGSTHRP